MEDTSDTRPRTPVDATRKEESIAALKRLTRERSPAPTWLGASEFRSIVLRGPTYIEVAAVELRTPRPPLRPHHGGTNTAGLIGMPCLLTLIVRVVTRRIERTPRIPLVRNATRIPVIL